MSGGLSAAHSRLGQPQLHRRTRPANMQSGKQSAVMVTSQLTAGEPSPGLQIEPLSRTSAPPARHAARLPWRRCVPMDRPAPPRGSRSDRLGCSCEKHACARSSLCRQLLWFRIGHSEKGCTLCGGNAAKGREERESHCTPCAALPSASNPPASTSGAIAGQAARQSPAQTGSTTEAVRHCRRTCAALQTTTALM